MPQDPLFTSIVPNMSLSKLLIEDKLLFTLLIITATLQNLLKRTSLDIQCELFFCYLEWYLAAKDKIYLYCTFYKAILLKDIAYRELYHDFVSCVAFIKKL